MQFTFRGAPERFLIEQPRYFAPSRECIERNIIVPITISPVTVLLLDLLWIIILLCMYFMARLAQEKERAARERDEAKARRQAEADKKKRQHSRRRL